MPPERLATDIPDTVGKRYVVVRCDTANCAGHLVEYDAPILLKPICAAARAD